MRPPALALPCFKVFIYNNNIIIFIDYLYFNILIPIIDNLSIKIYYYVMILFFCVVRILVFVRLHCKSALKTI